MAPVSSARPVETALWRATAVLVTLLAVELVTLAWFKVDIQSQFCGLAAWLRTTFVLGHNVNHAMKWFHYQTNSFAYMQVRRDTTMKKWGRSSRPK